MRVAASGQRNVATRLAMLMEPCMATSILYTTAEAYKQACKSIALRSPQREHTLQNIYAVLRCNGSRAPSDEDNRGRSGAAARLHPGRRAGCVT